MLTASTATIDEVCKILSKEVFQERSVTLLDNDDLEIPDTIATRGTSYYILILNQCYLIN